MNRSLLILLLVAVFCISWSVQLRCLPCPKNTVCPPVKCPLGSYIPLCECCPICRNGIGGKCGGSWNYLGKCGTGLVCTSEDGSVVDTSRDDNNGGTCSHLQKD